MKNIAVFLLLVVVVVAGACKKTTSPSASLVMSATVNGLPWRSYSATVAFDKGPGARIIIVADSTNSRINLQINGYHGVGTYAVTDSGTTASYYNFSAPSGNQQHTASSGSIEVTSNTQVSNTQTNIKGNFKFLSSSVSATNGLFDVTLNLD